VSAHHTQLEHCQTEIITEMMMTASSSFQNRVQDGDIYVGVPLAQDTIATKSTHMSKELLAFLLGLIMAFVSTIFLFNYLTYRTSSFSAPRGHFLP